MSIKPETARTLTSHAMTVAGGMRAVLAVLLLCLPAACAGNSDWSQGTGSPDEPSIPPGDDDDSVSSAEAALTEGTVLVEEHECFVSVVRSGELEILTFEFNCDPATTGIEVGGIVGRVVRISSYATVIRTLDNLTVIVPNAEIINTHVVNWNIDTPHVRLHLAVGVAYGSDTKLVQKLLHQAAEEHPQVLRSPGAIVRFDDFGDSALLFTLLPWTWDLDGRFVIESDLRLRIDELFTEHGVEIPFPQPDAPLPPRNFFSSSLYVNVTNLTNYGSFDSLNCLVNEIKQSTYA